jgi:hypothetical protein
MKPFLIVSVILFPFACKQFDTKKVPAAPVELHKKIHPDSEEYVNSPNDTVKLISLFYPHLKIESYVGYRKAHDDDFFKFYGTRVLSIQAVPDDSTEHYIIIFETVPFDTIGKEMDCGGCEMVIGWAELFKEDGHYIASGFKERIDSNNSADIKPVVCIEKIGLSEYALGITYRFAMGALDDKMEVFHQIPGGAKIFSYQPQLLRDVYIFNGMPEEETYKTLNRMYTFLPDFLSPKYYDFYMVAKKMKYNSKKNKEVETVKEEYYRMDVKKNYYTKYKL